MNRPIVLTLALGISAATAVITVAEAVLLRSLPVARDDDVRGVAPVLVLSHKAWQQHFAGETRVARRAGHRPSSRVVSV